MDIPIALSLEHFNTYNKRVLAVDIGGTKAHLALYHFRHGEVEILRDQRFPSQEYATFQEILEDFEWDQPRPDSICIAFAGPILNGRAQATNLPWALDVEQMRQELDFYNIHLINDLESNAYGLAGLGEDDIVTIQKGNPELKGNAGIIAPGTGLGEAGMYWDGKKLHPFAAEGGHSSFGPRDEVDDAIMKHLRFAHGHVSWERLVSGMGIWNIYQFLVRQADGAQPEWLQKEIETNPNAIPISKGAKKGNPTCQRTMKLFFKYLAYESASLVVKLKATGGLFIGGGVVPKNMELLDVPVFLEHFRDLGRFRSMIEQIPVHIILNQETALIGAAYYGAFVPNQ
ncbi:MAG: glucokinase [Bacteroidota bacterium]